MIYMNYCKHNIRFLWFFWWQSGSEALILQVISLFLVLFSLWMHSSLKFYPKMSLLLAKGKNVRSKQRRNEVLWCCRDVLAYESCSQHVRRRVCLTHRRKQTSHLHDFNRYVQRILKWWFKSGDSHQSVIISSKIMAIWFNYFDHICSSALRIWSRIWFLLSGSCLCKLVLRLHDQLKYYQREEAAIFYFLRVKCCLNSILMKHYRAAEMQCTSHHSHLSWIVFFIVSWCLKCTMW